MMVYHMTRASPSSIALPPLFFSLPPLLLPLSPPLLPSSPLHFFPPSSLLLTCLMLSFTQSYVTQGTARANPSRYLTVRQKVSDTTKNLPSMIYHGLGRGERREWKGRKGERGTRRVGKKGSDGQLLSNSCYVSHSLIRDCVENFSSPIPNLG